jgi:hypothetical protein
VRLGVITAAWRRLNAHPSLYVRNVPQGHEDAPRAPEAELQVAEWVSKALVQEDGFKVANEDLLHSFRGWQREEMGDGVRLLDVRAFIPVLHAVSPWITTVKVFGNRYAGGVMLTAEGLRYWERQRGCGSRGIAFSSEYVNVPWRGRTHERTFKAAAAPAQLGLQLGGGGGELSAARPQEAAKR